MLFIICFNSNSETQVNHLREGSGLLCVRYSRDGLAGGDLGWEQGNHVPSQSPTGLRGLLSGEGVAGGLAQSPEEQGLPVAMAGVKGPPLGVLLPSSNHCPPVNALSSAANCIYGFLEFSKWSNYFLQTVFFSTEIGSPLSMETNKTAWHHPPGSGHFRRSSSFIFNIRWMWFALGRSSHPALAEEEMVPWACLEELGGRGEAGARGRLQGGPGQAGPGREIGLLPL